MDNNAPQEPSGFFRVINDTFGAISRGAEAYHDVRGAPGETMVTAVPVAPSVPQAPAGTASPEIAEARKLSATAVPGGMTTQQIVILSVAGVAALGLVVFLARRK